jgi:GLPGLI family protein
VVHHQKINNMKNIIILIAALLTGNVLLAQNAHFTTSGVIEFEKSINMYAIIRNQITKSNESYMKQAFEQYQKTQPQFKKSKSTLTFTDDKSLFTPLPDEGNNNAFFGSSPMVNQINTTATDFNTGSSTTQKKVFEEVFLVKDSLRKINWKITEEARDIAGFSCRRANAVIMDSIYVVAFYTDQIAVPGGPESFTGLPGMILGLALPHDHITWFATKVTDMPVVPAKLAPPAKGKPVDNKQLRTTLQGVMKDWGNEGNSILKVALL